MTRNFDAKDRALLPPLSVRLSPDEREAFRQKARDRGISVGELIRRAVAVYDLKAALAEDSRTTPRCHVEPALPNARGELTTEYDPPEVVNG